MTPQESATNEVIDLIHLAAHLKKCWTSGDLSNVKEVLKEVLKDINKATRLIEEEVKR